jgi:hypothetical protein
MKASVNPISPIQSRAKDRRLYVWAAIATALIVLTGFARTYYLKGVFGTPALSGLVHLHGFVMTLWVAMFIVQTGLISARRTDLHRRLGVIGGVLAGLVLVMGTVTAIAAAKRGGEGEPPPLVFLAVPLGDMLVFAILVGTALFYKRRPDIHKRLMLLSCGAILTAAIARIPLNFIETGGPLVFFGLTDICVIACVAFDTLKHCRLHPAFGWGLLLLIASQPLRLLLSGTQVWLQFATWLAG